MGLELEILHGEERAPVDSRVPGPGLRRAVSATLRAAEVDDGHLAVTLLSPEEIRELNRHHRGRDEPTDVLSFPVDEQASEGPRELGDVVICPALADDLARAAVHGVLHLLGHDHEADAGEMLALEDEIARGLR